MSATGEAARAEGAALDAAASQAETASNAAAEAIALAAVAAANAEESAHQRTAEIASTTGQAIQSQEETIAWLRENVEALTAREQAALSRLEAMEGTSAETNRLLSEIQQRLTPPASVEPEAETAVEPDAANLAATPDRSEAQEAAARQRPKHRWI